MGPPGSGKTTLGTHVSQKQPETSFVSVGGYMRGILGLKPPFENVDRQKVFKSIIFNHFALQKNKHLIIDCNPFPGEMWNAVLDHLHLFKKKRFILIDTPMDVLGDRLSKRNRDDEEGFPFQKRIDYYQKNVFPAIQSLSNTLNLEHFSNKTPRDIDTFLIFLNNKL